MEPEITMPCLKDYHPCRYPQVFERQSLLSTLRSLRRLTQSVCERRVLAVTFFPVGPPVPLSDRVEQLGSRRADFRKNFHS